MSNRSPSLLCTSRYLLATPTSITPRLESQEDTPVRTMAKEAVLVLVPSKGYLPVPVKHQHCDGSRCLFECNDPFNKHINAMTVSSRNTCYSTNSYVLYVSPPTPRPFQPWECICPWLQKPDFEPYPIQGTCRCRDSRNLFECTNVMTPSRSH
jgi:hypothetical protein